MIDLIFFWIKDFLTVLLMSLVALPLTLVYDILTWLVQTSSSIIDCFRNGDEEEKEETQTNAYHEPTKVKGFHKEGGEDD